ncbi:PEP-CTERM sorting domain-containing protein [Erythrobacter alti]
MTLLAATPATSVAVQVPEASSVTLFALGTLGLIIGRRLAKRSSNRED